MIGVKEAVNKAIDFVQDLYGDTAAALSLEEVELTDDGRYWLITVGFVRPQLDNPLRVFAGGAARAYKVIKVDAQTGEPLSMKIRETEVAL